MTKKPRPGSGSKKRTKRTSIPAHFAARPKADAGQPGSELDARPAAVSRSVPITSGGAPVASARLASARSSIQASYDYVISDVKRIGITSGAMLAIIVGLTFVIR